MASLVFDAPIPGQSLTTPPGSSPLEKPPQFARLDEAIDYMWDKFFQKKQLERTIAMIKADIPIAEIAKTITYASVATATISADLAPYLLEWCAMALESIAKRKGISYVTHAPDTDQIEFMVGMADLLDANEAEKALKTSATSAVKEEKANEKMSSIFGGLA